MPELEVKALGLQPYGPIVEAMKDYTQARTAKSPDQLWWLEHSPVFTQGQAGKAEHIIAAGDIPVVQSDRGGQVTYHGPGQLVVYLLLDLKRHGLGVRDLVSLIEDSLVGLLAGYGIAAAARPDAPGVYVDGRKIASLGLRIRRGCSYHGLGLNVCNDLSPFARINPCGMERLQMTSIAQESPGKDWQVAQVAADWLALIQPRLQA